MEFKNDLDLAAYVAAHSVLSGTYKDLDGNVKVMLPSGAGSSLDFDQFRRDTNPSIIDTNPPVGADVYPGSLAKGEITGRYLLSDTVTDPTAITNIVFKRDVGIKMNMVGDGLRFHIYLQKNTITKGIKGESKRIELNYDPKNTFKDGYYTTTSPIPISIKGANFNVDVPVEVPLDGIGENLGLSNIKVPAIVFTFKSDKSMNIESIQGYENDGDSAGVNGVTYDVICELISTYIAQEAVPQLPSDVILFVGDIDGDVELSGTNIYFDNIGDMIEIDTEDYLYLKNNLNSSSETKNRIAITYFNIPNKFQISKHDLIVGNNIDIDAEIPNITSMVIESWINNKWYGGSGGHTGVSVSVNNQSITIKDGKISIGLSLRIFWKDTAGRLQGDFEGTMRITSVKTIKGSD